MLQYVFVAVLGSLVAVMRGVMAPYRSVLDSKDLYSKALRERLAFTGGVGCGVVAGHARSTAAAQQQQAQHGTACE